MSNENGKLQLKKVQAIDSGDYKILAKNIAGEAEAIIQLQVLGIEIELP